MTERSAKLCISHSPWRRAENVPRAGVLLPEGCSAERLQGHLGVSPPALLSLQRKSTDSMSLMIAVPEFKSFFLSCHSTTSFFSFNSAVAFPLSSVVCLCLSLSHPL